jgi:hypothetical protein
MDTSLVPTLLGVPTSGKQEPAATAGFATRQLTLVRTRPHTFLAVTISRSTFYFPGGSYGSGVPSWIGGSAESVF